MHPGSPEPRLGSLLHTKWSEAEAGVAGPSARAPSPDEAVSRGQSRPRKAGLSLSALLLRGGRNSAPCYAALAVALCLLALALCALWVSGDEHGGGSPADVASRWGSPLSLLLGTHGRATVSAARGNASGGVAADAAHRASDPCTSSGVRPPAPAPCACDAASLAHAAPAAPAALESPSPVEPLTQPDSKAGGPGAPSPIDARVQELLGAWSQAHSLEESLPPGEVVNREQGTGTGTGNRDSLRGATWAPHLEECSAMEERHAQAEGFSLASRNSSNSSNGDGGGEGADPPTASLYPAWACVGAQGEAPCSSPKPPWVRGADEDNLPLTRAVQRDVWLNQFPADQCQGNGKRFLVVMWGSLEMHGVGSQVLLMAMALGLALRSGRVLVTGGYSRADHPGCARFGRNADFDCYFAPTASYPCLAKGRSLLTAGEVQWTDGYHWKNATLSNSTDVVFLDPETVQAARWDTSGLEPYWDLLGPLMAEGPATREVLGSVEPRHYEGDRKTTWMRSQMYRFLLRWPSAYLCHLANRARHRAFGHLVAREVAQAEAMQEALEGGSVGQLEQKEREALHSNDARGVPVQETPDWRFHREPYIPRPIVSVHVRQGDKAREMQIFSFESFMWTAYRMRKLVPGLKFVWLSTEMELVVNQTAAYKDWTFFYTEVGRQLGNTSMREFEESRGFEQRVGDSWANLLVSAQCDMFIGVLGSTWSRIINALRLTGGRLKASFMSLNEDDMW